MPKWSINIYQLTCVWLSFAVELINVIFFSGVTLLPTFLYNIRTMCARCHDNGSKNYALQNDVNERLRMLIAVFGTNELYIITAIITSLPHTKTGQIAHAQYRL